MGRPQGQHSNNNKHNSNSNDSGQQVRCPAYWNALDDDNKQQQQQQAQQIKLLITQFSSNPRCPRPLDPPLPTFAYFYSNVQSQVQKAQK